MQWTWKAYAALLEGPFAESILQRSFLFGENLRLQGFTDMDETGAEVGEDQRHSLDLIKKLEDRVMENVKKFPWKTTFPDILQDELCLDFT
jgi:hypothetical protein